MRKSEIVLEPTRLSKIRPFRKQSVVQYKTFLASLHSSRCLIYFTLRAIFGVGGSLPTTS